MSTATLGDVLTELETQLAELSRSLMRIEQEAALALQEQVEDLHAAVVAAEEDVLRAEARASLE